MSLNGKQPFLKGSFFKLKLLDFSYSKTICSDYSVYKRAIVRLKAPGWILADAWSRDLFEKHAIRETYYNVI